MALLMTIGRQSERETEDPVGDEAERPAQLGDNESRNCEGLHYMYMLRRERFESLSPQ
jgi:hypothetical protein